MDYIKLGAAFFAVVVVVVGTFLIFESNSTEKKPFLGKISMKNFLEHPLEAHE